MSFFDFVEQVGFPDFVEQVKTDIKTGKIQVSAR